MCSPSPPCCPPLLPTTVAHSNTPIPWEHPSSNPWEHPSSILTLGLCLQEGCEELPPYILMERGDFSLADLMERGTPTPDQQRVILHNVSGRAGDHPSGYPPTHPQSCFFLRICPTATSNETL